MTDFFPRAVSIVLEAEGLLSDDPRDAGGLTKYGISQRAYPDLDIRALTRDDAVGLYRRDYWDKCRCGGLPWWAALITFDCAVNQGPGVAARLLQRAVGAPEDGLIGPKTIVAVAKMDPRVGSAQFLSHRAIRYTQAEGFDRFGRGWMVRLFDVAFKTEAS